jgi:hypothetical protein
MSAAAQLVAGASYEVPSSSAQTGRDDISEWAPPSTTTTMPPLQTLLPPPPPPPPATAATLVVEADPVASVILTPTRTINLQKQLLADMIKLLSGDGLCIFSGESQDILFPCQLTLTTNVGPNKHDQVPYRKLNVTSVPGISGDDVSKSQWSASIDCSRIVNTELFYLYEDQQDFEQDEEFQVPLPAILVEFYDELCNVESIQTRKIILREEEVEGGETQTLHLGLCALISDSKPPRINKRAPLATSISLLGVTVGVGKRKSPSKEIYKETHKQKVSGDCNCHNDNDSDDDNSSGSAKGSPTPVKPRLKTPVPVSAFTFAPEFHFAENKTEGSGFSGSRNKISTRLVLAEGEEEYATNPKDDDTKENSFVHLNS